LTRKTVAPTPVQNSRTFQLTSIGFGSACAADISPTGPNTFCWGLNSNGQLGNGLTGLAASSPTPVAVLNGHHFLALSVGVDYACGIDGQPNLTGNPIFCWGDDANGQLGDGTTGNGSAVPIRVVNP
jgi:hypothetical protein